MSEAGAGRGRSGPAAEQPGARDTRDGGEEPRNHDECYACPIGGLFLTARTSPQAGEALDHLVSAASELVAAAKSMAEAAEVFLEQQRARGSRAGDPPPPSRVQRIDLDEPGG